MRVHDVKGYPHIRRRVQEAEQGPDAAEPDKRWGAAGLIHVTKT